MRNLLNLWRQKLNGISFLAILSFTTQDVYGLPTEPDFQIWNTLVVEGNAGLQSLPGLRYSVEGQVRRMNAPLAKTTSSDGAVSYQQNPNTLLLIRPSLGYSLSPSATVWLGYAWQPDKFDDAVVNAVKGINEHRIWQQFSYQTSLGQYALSSRSRLEERFRSDGPGDGDWAYRFRQQFRMAYTIEPGQPWMLIASDEVFVHLNNTPYPTESGFDQNRLFLGVGYQSGAVRTELGYLNQYVHRFTDAHQFNNVLMLGIYCRFG